MLDVWWASMSVLRRFGISLFVLGLLILAISLPFFIIGPFGDRLGSTQTLADTAGASTSLIGMALAVVDRLRITRHYSTQDLDEAAERLARQVLARESQQRARLLGTTEPRVNAANLVFRCWQQPVEHQTEHLASYYNDLDSGRLVILGEPGGGKTVMALQLLVSLLEARQGRPHLHQRSLIPVPVRLSMPRWDTTVPAETWIAQEVASGYGLPALLAKALLENGRILPILDGLDEMDRDPARLTRARAAVEQLNRHIQGSRAAAVVITCRADQYQLLRSQGVSLRPASEIIVQPLTLNLIRDHLDDEYSASSDQDARQQWEPILRAMATPSGEELLSLLSNPWHLALAITFHRDGGDLNRLQGQSEAGASELLISTFIPARASLYRNDRYHPEQVRAWCRVLAGQLDQRVDIVLHEWWNQTDAGRLRRLHIALSAAAATGLMLLCLATVFWCNIDGMTDAVRQISASPRNLSRQSLGTCMGLMMMLSLTIGIPVMVIRRARATTISPTQINVKQIRSLCGRSQLRKALLWWSLVGLLWGIAFSAIAGVKNGLVNGLIGEFPMMVGLALVFGIVNGLRPIGEVASDPRDPIRNDLTIWFGTAIALMLVFAVAGAIEQEFEPQYTGAHFVQGSALMGFCIGIAVGLAVELAGHAWIRYLMAVVLMSRRHGLPLRFSAFLHWANQAGILRTAGNSYQFRNVELKSWLLSPSAAKNLPTS
jgi:hypothetical protein